MPSKKSFSAAISATALTLALAACSSDTVEPTPAPSATSAPTEAPGEMFEVGEVSFEDFEERVVPPNQAIKTLHVKATGEVSSGETSQDIISEGDVDQTDPNNVKFRMEATGDVEYTVVQVDGRQYYKEEGKPWTEAPMDVFPITTSTSLFQELGAIEDSVTKVEYLGLEDGAHKFSLDVNVDLVMGAEEGVFGDTVMLVWLNDDYELVKLDSTITVNGVTSAIVSEQSALNEPVVIEAPIPAE